MTVCAKCLDDFSAECGICEACGGQALCENELVILVRELDLELDGVILPSSAAAIINRLRELISEDRWI